MPNAPEWIALVDAALELRTPYRTAYEWMLTGKLDGAREGGRWMVTRASVAAARAHTAAVAHARPVPTAA